MSSLQDPNGGTDLNPPLNMARDLMEKYNDQYDCISLVMMSYGEAPYPSNGIENIKKSPAIKKLKFKSIAYGRDSESLTKMAKELGGNCEDILEPI